MVLHYTRDTSQNDAIIRYDKGLAFAQVASGSIPPTAAINFMTGVASFVQSSLCI